MVIYGSNICVVGWMTEILPLDIMHFTTVLLSI